MCEVYEFPTKARLTQELEEQARELARDYVKGINDLLDRIIDCCPDNEYAEELTKLVISVYMTEMFTAIDEI